MKKKSVLLVIAFSCIFSMSYAHSGRTDSSGGHKDNKNKSGLGYYHYHHGYPAHLHNNGVCPYEGGSTKKTSKKSTSSVDTKKIQNKLNELGYDCGEPDGKMGTGTKSAIIKFQEDKGLTPDGKVGAKTLEALGL
ncbi:MAG: peptidoglycan-binding protein [Fusobacteriaceae bacterium]|nr:peptidoglycan-binding protein [Fusobacteriaceae bacterium]